MGETERTDTVDHGNAFECGLKFVIRRENLPFAMKGELNAWREWIQGAYLMVRTREEEVCQPLFKGLRKYAVVKYVLPDQMVDEKRLLEVATFGLVASADFTANGMDPKDMTFMLAGHCFEEGLMDTLKEYGYHVEKIGEGVDRIMVASHVEIRLVNLKQLQGDEYACLRLIGKGATVDDIRLFMRQAREEVEKEGWPIGQA